MSEYKCHICEMSFSRRSHLDYHMSNNACKDVKFKCKLCGKGFTTNNSMYRHMKHNCKVKKQEEKEKVEIYRQLLELKDENSKLKEKVKLMKKENDNVNITNNINMTNINNGIIANITLVGYGKEDISKLDKDDMLKVLRNGYYSTIKLTEALHFNPKFPEYHNIYISNIKDKYAMMYDGTNWTLTMKDDLVNKIYNDKKDYIEENLDEFLQSLTLSRKKALERWLETNDEDHKIKEIKNQIRLLLYNQRKIPITTQNLVKNDSI
jgi:hypothetical protein